MWLDLRDADLGHEFKIQGGRRDGLEGNSLDLFRVSDDGEVWDEFETVTTDHVRTDLGPIATYVPRGLWERMDA